MDKIGLALMGKIIKLYENNENKDSFVTFRQIPMTYTSKNFIFEEDEERGIDTLYAKQNQLDFATLCNFIPNVSRFWNEKNTFLTQEFKAILASAVFPISSLSISDKKRLQEAKQYIQQEGLYENYISYRDEYFEVQEKINNFKLQSFDAETEEEKQLIADQILLLTKKLDSVESDWILLGNKIEVEEKVALINELETKGIADDWQEAKTKMADDGGIVQFDPITMQRLYPTTYSPKDFYKENTTSGWSKIILKRSEINQLSQFALDNLFQHDRQGLGNIKDELDVKEIKADVTKILVNRPWLSTALFTRRDWKLNNNEIISTGGEKPEGRMPAYIQSLLFVRNIEIDLVENSNKNKKTIEKYQQLKTPIQLGPVMVQPPKKSAAKVSKIKLSKKFNPKVADQFRTVVRDNKITSLQDKKSRNILKSKGLQTQIFTANSAKIKPMIKKPILLKPSTMLADKLHLITSKKQVGFKGQVKDDLGNPLQVSISFSELNNPENKKNFQSNNEGKYTALVKEGTYKIRISKTGFTPFEKTVKSTSKNGPRLQTLNMTLQNISSAEDELNEQHSGYLLFGYICNIIPKCPNPDESFNWTGEDEQDEVKDIIEEMNKDPLGTLSSLVKLLRKNS